MVARAYRLTATHKVRNFLAAQGVALRPWSGLDETYAELYGLLCSRKDDPTLWGPLSELLQELVDDKQGTLPAPRAELMPAHDVSTVVQDLRRALPGSDTRPVLADVQQFARSLSGAVLGSFLFLGLAVTGCDWSEGCTIEEESTIWSAIDESELGYNKRTTLCGCFIDVNEDWDEGLTALFENGTDQEIAGALEEMVECCQYDEWALNEDYTEVENQLVSGNLCEKPSNDPPPIGPQPAYKGVAFLS